MSSPDHSGCYRPGSLIMYSVSKNMVDKKKKVAFAIVGKVEEENENLKGWRLYRVFWSDNGMTTLTDTFFNDAIENKMIQVLVY